LKDGQWLEQAPRKAILCRFRVAFSTVSKKQKASFVAGVMMIIDTVFCQESWSKFSGQVSN
jgi:hypothetical protein